MKKKAEDLRIGDTLQIKWAGRQSVIKCFHEYVGPLDFVLMVAEFYDGTRMSISKDRYYNCV